MFEGFTTTRVDTGDATINAVHGGSGPPVLLLHGFPQTHAMWHRVAPELARGHTVVAPDLRGYGDSSRPPEGDDHGGYSFRSMAADQVAVMRSFVMNHIIHHRVVLPHRGEGVPPRHPRLIRLEADL